MLCLWQQKDFAGVLKKVTYLIQTTPVKYLHKLWVIRGLVNQYLGNSAASKSDLEAAMKYDADHAKRILDKETLQYNIFPIQSRLCSHFAYVKFYVPGGYSIVSGGAHCVDDEALLQFSVHQAPQHDPDRRPQLPE